MDSIPEFEVGIFTGKGEASSMEVDGDILCRLVVAQPESPCARAESDELWGEVTLSGVLLIDVAKGGANVPVMVSFAFG